MHGGGGVVTVRLNVPPGPRVRELPLLLQSGKHSMRRSLHSNMGCAAGDTAGNTAWHHPPGKPHAGCRGYRGSEVGGCKTRSLLIGGQSTRSRWPFGSLGRLVATITRQPHEISQRRALTEGASKQSPSRPGNGSSNKQSISHPRDPLSLNTKSAVP